MLAPTLAWRFLRDGRAQTLLILAGATVGVAAFVFVSAIIVGLQENLVDKTLGSQAHLTVLPEEPPPRPLYEAAAPTLYARRIEEPAPRRETKETLFYEEMVHHETSTQSRLEQL